MSDDGISVSDSWNLLPLTPGYLGPEHEPYVAALTEALRSPDVKNIALSGNYGVGKSSILKRVSELEDGRVVELSLSTLAPIEASTLDDSVPAQATTPTNRIQQEIVKQLLYREEPDRAPGSRFRRIERFQWKRELLLAGIVGFAVAVLFLLTGWATTITATLKSLVDLALWVYPIIFALTTGAVYALRALLHGRVHIKAFSAGPAAVTLDEKSVSFFDQYLDEIVYFFETTKYDIVIFEDIDRFNDSHIFETLRSLNTLLNATPEVRRTKRTIRFVYAIKDSIFDRIGLELEGRRSDAALVDITDPAEAETVRANRTKFFDLVIPVVPFITHRSARNLASQLLGELENDVSVDLIDLAGRFVPDMRLLKNVRNEFVVFRDRIFSGDGRELGLSETDLFAMMLYKSTHLSDFEAIRPGKSKLDRLYAVSRDLVATNTRRLEREGRSTRQQLVRVKNAPSRAEHMGTLLLEHIGRTARAHGLYEQNQRFTLQGKVVAVAELKGVEFWRELAESPAGATLDWRNNYGHSMTMSRQDLVSALGDSLDIDEWVEADKAALNETLAEQEEQRKFLRSADMGDLIKRPEFLVDFEGEPQSLESVADSLLTRGLAFQLVRAGYINRNFTLYTSTFHGDRVSSAATNFIIHHVEQNAMDVDFELGDDDVDAVVRERGVSALSEPALLNINILDRLLKSDIESADIMVTSIARLDESGIHFLQAYLAGGKERARFMERFVRKSNRVLPYLVTQAEVDDATRIELVSDALAHLAPGVKYFTDDAVTRFLREHYAELPVLKSDSLTPDAAGRITIVFGMAGLRLEDLRPLGATARQAFVDRNLFMVNQVNLLAALGDDADLGLDSIRAIDESVYEYLLDNLSDFLVAIDGHSASNASANGFTQVIEDVLEHDPDLLDEIIEHASDDSQIPDLSVVPEPAFTALARFNRFPATFANVKNYVSAAAGSLDTDLAERLKDARAITAIDDAVEADKIQLALTILATSGQLLHSSFRVPLVKSLDLEERLDVSAIKAENGQLFALLVQEQLVPDDEATYEHVAGIDWKWRERLIEVSQAFKSYMTPGLVGDDLSRLLASSKVGKPIKLAVLDDAAGYAEAADAAGRRELARFALANKRDLPIEVVEHLPADRTDAATVIALLQPYLGALDDSRLFSILRAIGGAYAQLSVVGRDKPKVPNTEANRVLLASLQRREIVSSFDDHGTMITVNKKHK